MRMAENEGNLPIGAGVEPKSTIPMLKFSGDWTPQQIEQFQDFLIKAIDENPRMRVNLVPEGNSHGTILDIPAVLHVVDDWEQTYFASESWPPHVKAHIVHALAQLRTRIKGLVS
jgi:hypothetical protein